MQYLVTGANRGLGLEFTKILAERGDHVIATARNPEDATQLKDLAKKYEGHIRTEALDLSNPESVEAFVAAVEDEPVDVLINNAGTYPNAGKLGELDYDKFIEGFEVNTIGPIRLAERLLDHLRKSERPVIMNVTSQMGSIADNGSGGAYAYRISKAALNMGIRSMAKDLAPENFVVFVIHPGWVQTDMGGPNAKIDTNTSVSGMISVLDSANHVHSGRFMNWDGEELPW